MPRIAALFISLSTALITACLGAIAMIGWTLASPRLTMFGSGNIAMKFNTSLGLFFSGMALLGLQKTAGSPQRRLGLAFAGFVLGIGVLTLAEYVFRANFGIDELIFKDWSDLAGATPPGRMAINTAASFALIGLALGQMAASSIVYSESGKSMI